MPTPKPASRCTAVFFSALLLTASVPTLALAAGGKGGGTGGGAGGTGYGGLAGGDGDDPSWLHAGGGGGGAGGGLGGAGAPGSPSGPGGAGGVGGLNDQNGAAPGDGGDGVAGVAGTPPNGGGSGGGGGAGGAGFYYLSDVPDLATTAGVGTIVGGKGGAGGKGFQGGAGGGGGDGGGGVAMDGGFSITANVASITGGDGGLAGNGAIVGGPASAGDGGRGGDGVSTTSGGSVVVSTGTITGGDGGGGGLGGPAGNGFGAPNPGSGGKGGAGGAGVSAYGGGGVTIGQGSIVAGGDGGAGGNGGSNANSLGGSGGAGGAGVLATGDVTVQAGASVTGGNGAAAGTGSLGTATLGAGGAGIQESGGGNVTIAGAVTGGMDGSNFVQAAAISFTSGGNTLTLESGYSLSGGAVSDGAGAGDRLVLGGGADDTFDLSLLGTTFQNFSTLGKTGSGTWTLTGTTSFSGDTTVTAGTLRVNGTLGGGVLARTSGVLTGSGHIMGDADLTGGGVLAGASGQTLRIDGNVTMDATSVVNVSLGATTSPALVSVGGALTLNGTLNVADAGGFGAGVYRLFDYGGALTDDGIALSALPGGATGSLQTSVASQVNLVVAGGAPPPVTPPPVTPPPVVIPTMQFWNGAGVWSLTPATSWADANGAGAAAWGGKFAIFQQNPGTVTVDDSGGAIATTGMQFIGQGWTVTGGAITLAGAAGETTVRVGDGTAAGAADVATIGAALAGDSRLVKDDLGTLILTTDNTFTGGTRIKAGTLQIGAGGAAGSIAGAVQDDGTLVFDRSDKVSFDGAISGAGAIHQAGSGEMILTGNSSAFTGTTYVDAGTLAVNGLLGGLVDVPTGGRLQGSGTVGSAIVQGTVAPGNSIGTLKVAGDVAFLAGSTYEVEANAAGQSDKIVAGGGASINGAAVRVLAGAGDYAPATNYTILTAAGGVTGAFTSVTSNLAFLDAALSYDATDVHLRLTRNDISFAGIGQTRNQIATGAATEALGWNNPVFDAAVNLSADQARGAFDQLSGEIHASARSAMVEDSRFLRSAVNDRLRAAFNGVGASSDNVTAYTAGGPQAVAANADGPVFWGQAFGSWGHIGSDGDAARLDHSIGGFFIGADATLLDAWRIGVVGGYSRSNFDARDRQSSGASEDTHLGVYGGTTWGDLALRTGAAYAWHDVSTTRDVAFPGFSDSPTADYHAATAQAFGELAYGVTTRAARLEPFANLAYVHLHTNDFTEAGQAAALAGAAADSDAAFTTVGLRASTVLDVRGAKLTPTGAVGWRHGFGDVTPSSTLRFADSGDAFTVAGAPIARDAAVIDAGLSLALSAAGSFGVSYGGQFGSGLSDQSARASFNVRF